jgi:50S ribosomal protein L16 3-hydroxylase
MLASLSEALLSNPGIQERYTDPDLETRDNPGQIESTEIQQVRKKLENLMQLDDASFARWFGQYVTEPSMDWVVTPDEAIGPEDLQALLDQQAQLSRSTASHLAWTESHGSLLFFADAESYTLEHTAQLLIEYLCRFYAYDTVSLQELIDNDQESIELLADLLNRGILEPGNGVED